MARLRTKRSRLIVRVALAALVPASLLSGSVAVAQEAGDGAWLQFQGGPSHEGAATGAPLPPYRERWRYTVPSGALSGAVIVDDLAIAVGEDAVVALDLATGEVAWEVERDGGPLSMPAVGGAEGRTLLVYADGPREDPDDASPSPSPTPTTSPSAGGEPAAAPDVSELVAIDLADRTEAWRVPLEAVSRSGVTIEGDRVYVGDDEGRVIALELGAGAEVWTTSAIGRIETPPVVADGTVVVAARDPDVQRSQVLALEAETGARAWAFSPAGGGAAASGVSASGGAVIVGAADRLVRSLALDGGDLRWDALTVTLFSPVSAPAVAAGAVYIADASGGLYRLDAADGGRAWEHQTNQLVVRSSPVVVGAYVLLGLNDGRLVAFDVARGDLVFQTPASQGLIGTIAVSNDVVVAVKGGKDPGLIAFEHDPDGSLVRIPSPTVLDPGRLFGGFVVAAIIASLVIFVPFRLLRSRFSPAFIREEGDAREPIEPTEPPEPTEVVGDEEPS